MSAREFFNSYKIVDKVVLVFFFPNKHVIAAIAADIKLNVVHLMWVISRGEGYTLMLKYSPDKERLLCGIELKLLLLEQISDDFQLDYLYCPLWFH